MSAIVRIVNNAFLRAVKMRRFRVRLSFTIIILLLKWSRSIQNEADGNKMELAYPSFMFALVC